MNLQHLDLCDILDPSVADEIRTEAERLEDFRWTRRVNLEPGRSISGSTCQYDFCGHAQMPLSLREKLKKLSPKYKDFPLAEIAINRYQVGDYIGKHKDRDFYRLNLVVALQQQGDGVFIDDEELFIEDKIGQGVLFKGIGPSHSVPSVKKLRYCLIYLYE
jgi:hypothetical protein